MAVLKNKKQIKQKRKEQELGKRRRNQSPQTLLAGTQSDAAAARDRRAPPRDGQRGVAPVTAQVHSQEALRTERRRSHTSLHVNVHSRPVHDRRKVETTQMFIDRGTDRRAFTRWAIISSPETESSIDTWNNVDGPWKHCAEWKEPGTRKATRYLFQLI